MTALLEATGLTAGYGGATVLRDVSVHVDEHEAVVVLGANGAGKSTLLSVLSGQLPYQGSLKIDGREVAKARPDTILAQGVSLVPQGRGTLTAMSVLDNLRVGAVTRKDRMAVEDDIERWFSVFPRLAERSDQVAGTLSGGEQQMLAIARALMSRPRLLMCDEVSLGLAPVIVQGLFDTLRDINRDSGTALLMVEQNAELAMDIASRVYLLEVGEVSASGSAEEFRADDSIRAAYLGY
ncbi:ABC transporter ATP-binding protein [Aeromicrobium tamlense]|uniref:ABC transporter ATP-binding protein n=1 Tax=Aeromicrobium tamlense TaxID=375541 RepID=A0A8I0FSL3_9ACTN|nr:MULTISPECIES: ABC transporter ATP-binding protein [Aeromicrobium]MBD1269190.1 ABC transporter ATP-binding protein [Aeromicrobium tamlense]NYI36901.1 branched-chain amino acid transport system ATP-binding protein [Aeromicrobium tamlense]